MLRPKNSKYRKSHRRIPQRYAFRGTSIRFGEYALRVIQPTWLTSRQIESRRRVLTRYVRRTGKLWIRVFPDGVRTCRAAETRIGSGKGNFDCWVAVVSSGTLIFEILGIPEINARQSFRIAASKLPTKLQFVRKY
jgi:large subunit ribosomal protein L16